MMFSVQTRNLRFLGCLEWGSYPLPHSSFIIDYLWSKVK
jgi:hypothetical protein